jgi:O-antigen/teichoic acid export membrane protein
VTEARRGATALGVNVAANYVGRVWAAVASIIFVPLYLTFLGAEAYGLIGFYASVQGVLVFTNLGLTAMLDREAARLSTHEGSGDDLRDTVRTAEVLYGCVLGLLAAGLIAGAPIIATKWLRLESLSQEVVTRAFRFMTVSMLCQFGFNLYEGGLLGLQRHVLSNLIGVVTGSLRGIGAIIVLWKVAPTPDAFFAWQAVVGVLQLTLGRWALLRAIPGPTARRTAFRTSVLRRTWRFAAGVFGLSVTSALLMQADKLVVSRLLPLAALGWYTLAWTAAQAPVSVLAGPIQRAVLPRLTQYASLGDQASVARLYEEASQFVAFAVIPVGVVLAFFSTDALSAWLGPNVAVQQAALPLRLLAVSATATGVLLMPYALMLAYGWTTLSFVSNLIALILFPPAVIVLTKARGLSGTAATWVLLNTGAVLIVVGLMHRRLLPGHGRRWVTQSVLIPWVVAATTALVCAGIRPVPAGRLAIIAELAAIWVICACATGCTLRVIRERVLALLAGMPGWRQGP